MLCYLRFSMVNRLIEKICNLDFSKKNKVEVCPVKKVQQERDNLHVLIYILKEGINLQLNTFLFLSTPFATVYLNNSH